MKEFFKWSDDISVGIDEIDEQHKVLILLINKLYDAIIHPANRDESIKIIMNDLIAYTKTHFAVEEALFRIFEYEGYEEHKNHHQNLVNQLININEKIQSGEQKGTIDLMIFLKRWLKKHIMVEDKRYVPFLVQQGVKKSWNKSFFGKLWL